VPKVLAREAVNPTLSRGTMALSVKALSFQMHSMVQRDRMSGWID
jgi:hypothetical protein